VREGDLIRIVIDRNRLTGSIDLVGDASGEFGELEGSKILAARSMREDLAPDARLPADTRLWAALQRASGGTWGGCVYDVEQIVQVLEAGERALSKDSAPPKPTR